MVASQATKKWSFEGPNLPIDTVTIYRPSEAQVTRKLDMDLEVCREPRAVIHLVTLRLTSYD